MKAILLNDKGDEIAVCELFTYNSLELSDKAKAMVEFYNRFDNMQIAIIDIDVIEIINKMPVGNLSFQEWMLEDDAITEFEFDNVKIGFSSIFVSPENTGAIDLCGFTFAILKTSDENIVKLQEILQEILEDNIQDYLQQQKTQAAKEKENNFRESDNAFKLQD